MKLLVEDATYVLMRRFSAKEEERRLVAAPLIRGSLNADVWDWRTISTTFAEYQESWMRSWPTACQPCSIRPSWTGISASPTGTLKSARPNCAPCRFQPSGIFAQLERRSKHDLTQGQSFQGSMILLPKHLISPQNWEWG